MVVSQNCLRGLTHTFDPNQLWVAAKTCLLARRSLAAFSFFSNYYGWMSVLADHTVLPPGADQGSYLQDLAGVLNTDAEVSLVTPDGRVYKLVGEFRNFLAHASKALSEGHAVTIEPRRAVLSTQEAADLLGVSRPTLVKLLESGEIPFTKPGRHRRVRLEDLLAYQQRVRQRRGDELAAMSAEAAEGDAYRVINGFTDTR